MNGTSELVVSVKLKADGSGLVGQTRQADATVAALGNTAVETGAKLQTVSAGANAAARSATEVSSASGRAKSELAALGAEVQQARTNLTSLGTATTSVVADERQFEMSLARLRAQLDPLGEAQRQAARDVEFLETALQRGAPVADLHAAAVKRLEAAQRGQIVSAGQQRMAMMMVGQQFQDIGIQVSMGTDLMRVAAMQGGQLALAFDQMGLKGAGGRFAAFMAGPMGAVLLLTGSLLAPVISKLWDASSATNDLRKKLDDAAESSDSFGTAQSLLGRVIDLNTGKFKSMNLELRETIRLQATLGLVQARKDEKEARKALDSMTSVSDLGLALTYGGDETGMSVARGEQNARRDLAPMRDVFQRFDSGAINISQARVELEKLSVAGKLAGKDVNEVTLAMINLGTARNDQQANQAVIDAVDGKGVDSRLKPYEKDKKPPKPKSTASRDEFGRDAADRIASITEAFDNTPAQLRQAQRAIRDLDDLIEDLGRKRPPNFRALIDSAEEAKGVVRAGLIRTITEGFEKPETLADRAADAMGHLSTIIAQLGQDKPKGFEGLIADAEKAKQIVQEGLARPLTDYLEGQEQALQVQQLVTAGKVDEAEALRVIIQLERQMGPLTEDRRRAVLATVQAIRAEQREMEILRQRQQVYLNSLGDIRSLISQTIVDGAEGLENLPDRLLDVFKRFQAEWLTEMVFGDTFRKLEDQVTGTNIVKDASEKMASAVDGATASIGRFEGALDSFVARQAGDLGESVSATATQLELASASLEEILNVIVVQGKKPDAAGASGMKDPKNFFGDAMGDVIGTLLKGIGINDTSAESIGKQAGKYTGIALKGAMEGQLASGIASMLGIKQSSTGAAIGGGIGGLVGDITGIPGLGFIGGLLGGTIGGLFEKPKYGTASVTSATDDAALSGSNAGLRKSVGSLAEQVQKGVRQIADQLGGTMGSFDLAIGTWNDRYRVNTFGTNKELHSKNFGPGTLFDFGDDEGAALSFAIADAIKDGAVKGLSAAVQKALGSSSDAQEALAEALKVADLELLIGGVGAQLEHEFKQFDRMAAERVDLARKYGLDLLEVERINAEERADLLDQTLKSRVGELQNFLDNVRYGDLFEGTAAERRTAILSEIEEAQQDAEAGVDGAADRLAALYRQLTETSREAFGTAGPEYASDRQAAMEGVERVIQIERDRVAAAAAQTKAQTDAILTGNQLTDESNDLLSVIGTRLQALLEAVERGGGLGGGGGDTLLTQREMLR